MMNLNYKQLLKEVTSLKNHEVEIRIDGQVGVPPQAIHSFGYELEQTINGEEIVYLINQDTNYHICSLKEMNIWVSEKIDGEELDIYMENEEMIRIIKM